MQNTTLLDNETYLSGLQTNDDSVIEQIFTHFKVPVVQLLLKKSATLPEAEDIFMDALEAIYNRVQKEQLVLHNCTFKTYLTSVCLKQWYNQCRRKKFKTDIIPEELTALKSNDNLEEELFKAERASLFWDAFTKMGEACRSVLQLAVIENQSLMEIGKQLGYTYDYARKKKSQCQRKLVKLIKDDQRFHELKP